MQGIEGKRLLNANMLIIFLFGVLVLNPVLAAEQSTLNSEPGNYGKSNSDSALVLIPVNAETISGIIRETGGQVTLVNIWATWCQPCREEMADLLKVYHEFKSQGMRLILISGDFLEDSLQAKRFLLEHKIDFQTYIKTGKDMPFINAFSHKWTGALPATFVYNQEDSLVNFWEGKASYTQFKHAVIQVLTN